MAKVKAPNTEYNGISAGVKFTQGIGECTDPYLLTWFKDKGYDIEETMEESFIMDVEVVKDQLDDLEKTSPPKTKRGRK